MIPEFKITNARYRGPKESAKMNVFISNMEWNLNQLKERTEQLRSNLHDINDGNRNNEFSSVTSLKKHIERLEKRIEK